VRGGAVAQSPSHSHLALRDRERVGVLTVQVPVRERVRVRVRAAVRVADVLDPVGGDCGSQVNSRPLSQPASAMTMVLTPTAASIW
jgi:hypothetical protein